MNVSNERRRCGALRAAVAADLARGAEIESRDGPSVVLLGPRARVNHAVHVVLSFVTSGMWVPIWLLRTTRRSRIRLSEADGLVGRHTEATWAGRSDDESTRR